MANKFRPFKGGKEVELIIQLPSNTVGGFANDSYAKGIEGILKGIENVCRLSYVDLNYELILNTYLYQSTGHGYKSKIDFKNSLVNLSIRLYLDKDVDRGIFSCKNFQINTGVIITDVFSCIIVDKSGPLYKDYDYRAFSEIKKI